MTKKTLVVSALVAIGLGAGSFVAGVAVAKGAAKVPGDHGLQRPHVDAAHEGRAAAASRWRPSKATP